MYLNSQQEKNFYNILSAYGAEFGEERIIIYLPTILYNSFNLKLFAPIQVVEWNENYIYITIDKYTAHHKIYVF